MPRAWWARAVIGAVCGLAWACALRAYMEQLAGFSSRFEWMGTFFSVLLPGVLIGAVLGAASALGPDHRALLRWAAASPFLFAVFVFVLPGTLLTFLTTGLGGGALGVPLAALAGGYALGGRRLWLRILAAVAALLLLVGLALTVPLVGGLPLTTPQGAWAALLVVSLLLVAMLAASIPFARQRREERRI
ncbi:hypothetical protein [Leifsonia sp. NPDC077715]|uniref:hypothetical protein n=1 Tax=Leifsonia sp. NPDC077715 TaxID=3155539 RepID=UPI003428F000